MQFHWFSGGGSDETPRLTYLCWGIEKENVAVLSRCVAVLTSTLDGSRIVGVVLKRRCMLKHRHGLGKADIIFTKQWQSAESVQ